MVRRISNRLSELAKAPGNAVSLLRCTRDIRALDGYSNPRKLADFCFQYPICPQQIPEEMINLFEIVSELRPKSAMEIGTYNGGTLFMTCRLADANATIISVDLPGGRFGGGYVWPRSFVYRNFAKDNQAIHLLRRNSHDVKTKNLVRSLLQGRPLDFLFIDGDHTYKGVKADFEMYGPLVRRSGVVAFHDIASHPPETACEVDRFWNEVKRNYRRLEIIKDPLQGWAGIGVLYM